MIERAGPLHPEALAAIHATAFPPGEAWSAPILAGHLSMPGVFAFIDPRGGMVLARIAADEAEILTVAVSPAARRQRLGHGLMQEAARHAAEAGATRLYLEVAATNTAALALYASLGFNAVGHRTDYYGPGSHALVCEAALPLYL
jgi:ribosomal-protein-alanine N-acetyltransferase